jgi:uncharacterized cupin superfamily protein
MSDQKKIKGPVAIEDLPWQEWAHGVRYGSRYRTLSDTRGDDRKIGIAYEELPPGKQSVTFHYHLLEEEHIIALKGEATLRLGDERYLIKAGDYIAFPAGQRAGHCLINETDTPFLFIIIGDREPHDVCIYPDSRKIMIRGLDRAMIRDGERLDYWEGERADEPITGART